MTDSEFLRWFEAQFGVCPLTEAQVNELNEQIGVAEEAKVRLRADLNYRRMRDAALKAWCAAREVKR